MSEPHETAGELLSRIAEQEGRLAVTSFSHEDALRLGMMLAELARGRGLVVAVDVTRGEQQVFHAGLTGSNADNDDWIARKVRTTKRFGRSSLAIRLESEARAASPRSQSTRGRGSCPCRAHPAARRRRPSSRSSSP